MGLDRHGARGAASARAARSATPQPGPGGATCPRLERRPGNDAAANAAGSLPVRAQVVVASGGVCLPVNVDYSVPTWATRDRPLRDGLPPFQADRGGLRFVSPPDIGIPSLQAASSGLGSATGIWTEATDASPAGATKPVYQVQCGTEELVYVNAIPHPGRVRQHAGQVCPRAGRRQYRPRHRRRRGTEAELELLTLMYDSSKQVGPEQFLGAMRDLLASADCCCAVPVLAPHPAQRGDDRRLSRLGADLIRCRPGPGVAHDNAGVVNVLAVSDDQIAAWLKARNINVVWPLDGLKAGTYGTGGSAITNQFFGLMGTSARAAVAGTVLRCRLHARLAPLSGRLIPILDGGRLDLGVVRDSTLDATNDYETFVETFEGVAFRGLEAYQVQSSILPNGGSSGTVAVSGYHE